MFNTSAFLNQLHFGINIQRSRLMASNSLRETILNTVEALYTANISIENKIVMRTLLISENGDFRICSKANETQVCVYQ